MGGFLWARRAEMKTMSDGYRLLPATGRVKRHAKHTFFLAHERTVVNPGATEPAGCGPPETIIDWPEKFTPLPAILTLSLVFMVFFCRAPDLLGRIFFFIQRYLFIGGLHQIDPQPV